MEKAGLVLTCDGLTDNDVCVSLSVRQIMNDTVYSRPATDDTCHLSWETLVVVPEDKNN